MKRFLLIFGLLFVASCQDGPVVSPELDAEKQNLHKLATTAKNNGDYNNASLLESQIINLEKNDPNSFIAISKTLKKQGLKAQALTVLQTGEKLNPGDEKLRLEVVVTLMETGQAQPALDKLLTIKTLRNNDYYNALGVAYDMTGDHDTAQETFHEGLQKSPHDGQMLNNLALSYILNGDYNKAVAILKPLTKRADAKPKYRQNLALAYGMMAKPQDAYLQLIKDIPKDQADENLKFYKDLRAK